MLRFGNQVITNKRKIHVSNTNTISQTIFKNSSKESMSPKFNENRQGKIFVVYASENKECYNRPFFFWWYFNLLAILLILLLTQIRSKHLLNKSKECPLQIIDKIWESCHFSLSCLQTIIKPIPKTRKDNIDPNNHRQIAICKTIERMINTRLVWFLETNNISNNVKYGFIKKNLQHHRSTCKTHNLNSRCLC